MRVVDEFKQFHGFCCRHSRHLCIVFVGMKFSCQEYLTLTSRTVTPSFNPITPSESLTLLIPTPFLSYFPFLLRWGVVVVVDFSSEARWARCRRKGSVRSVWCPTVSRRGAWNPQPDSDPVSSTSGMMSRRFLARGILFVRRGQPRFFGWLCYYSRP